MRVAYVYDAVFPWETGGVQKRMWEIGRRLADRHDVHWYGLKYWDGPATIRREGMTFHGVMRPPDLYVDGHRSVTEAVAFGARLFEPLLREQFDVIDCQEFPYFPVFPSKLHSGLRRTPLLVTWHEVWGEYWYEYLGASGLFGRAVERLVAALPDAHVAVSGRTRDDLGGLGVREARVIPNGVEMAEIAAAPPSERTVDLLFVGRLIPEKGADLLVRAVETLRTEESDVRCVVVGDGPERDRLEAMARDLNVDSCVTFTGRMDDYEDVLGLMKAASVFVLPSRREGFGISALEALACGTPVVTAAHPQNAATELVTDGETGVVCPRESDAIAEGVRRARAEASPAACTAFARGYEWDRIAERTESVYARLVGG